MEIFTTESNYDIEQIVLKQKGKTCAELGEYVRLKDAKALQAQLADKDKELEAVRKSLHEAQERWDNMPQELMENHQEKGALQTKLNKISDILTPTPDPLLDVKGGPDLQPPTGRD